MAIKLIVSAVVLTAMCLLSACSGSRGWRVEFGVAPVSSLHNQAGLNEKK